MEYEHNWHIDSMADHLTAVSLGHFNRLLINVPPGTMKSMTASVLWPSWEWGPFGHPSERYLTTSFKEDAVERDSRRMRDLVLSPWYQEHWPITLTRRAATSFENTATGWREAQPFSSLTSWRAGRLIIDDPHSVKMAESDAEREDSERTFRESATTRLSSPVYSAIVLIMQRLHDRDLSGVALAERFGYQHVMFPMRFEVKRQCYTIVRPSWMSARVQPTLARYWPRKGIWLPVSEPLEPEDSHYRTEIMKEEPVRVFAQDKREEEGELLFPKRFPPDVVDRDEKAMGAVATAGQNQQRPMGRGGSLFQKRWFEVIKALPAGAVNGGMAVRGWDLAGSVHSTSPYSSGVRMVLWNSAIYVTHVERFRGTPKEVEDSLHTWATLDGHGTHISLPQDPGQAGKAQVQAYVSRLHGWVVRYSPETGSKYQRAEPYAVQAEARNVKILQGPWNAEYLDELELFPRGQFADQVDASSRAYAYLISTPEPDGLGGAWWGTPTSEGEDYGFR